MRPLAAPSRLAAWLVLAAFASSCLSVRSPGTRPMPAGTGETAGGVVVRVFADDDGRISGALAPRGLVAELQQRQGREWKTVFRSLDAAWTVLGLEPGAYRLLFPARLDAQGNVLAVDPQSRSIKVVAGQVTDVEVVLEHVPRLAIAAGAIAGVALAVLLHEWLQDHDLPSPPLPPPPPALLDAVFWLALDVSIDAASWRVAAPGAPPLVTSHFPAAGDLVAAPRVRVLFLITTAVDAASVEPDAIMVLSETEGLVPGSTRLDVERNALVWTPREDLPRGQELRVTLQAHAFEDRDGNELETPYSFSFRTGA